MKKVEDVLWEYERDGLSEGLQQYLMSCGLSKTQAESTTTRKLFEIFMNSDAKVLMAESRNVVHTMKECCAQTEADYLKLKNEIDEAGKAVKAITDAKEQFGEITDDKVKNTLVLYSAVLSMNEKAGAHGVDAITGASYIAYAYLGGQAKREITFSHDDNENYRRGLGRV